MKILQIGKLVKGKMGEKDSSVDVADIEQPKENKLMEKYLENSEFKYNVSDTVEGKIIAKDRSSVFVDLGEFIGIIYGREFLIAKDILRKSQIGDNVSAKIIALDNGDGYIDLSLQEARNAMIWEEAEKAIESAKIFTVTPKDANRGGLIIEWRGLRGFLPASQLSSEHHPKALNGNKEAILSALKKLVGETLYVQIITVDKEDGKIVFSERPKKQDNDSGEKAHEYKAGDKVSGVITGVVDFGVFVKIDDKTEGLVHISQMEWGLVHDPHKLYSIGDNVNVKVTEISEDGKYSLSIKELKENPWSKFAEKYKAKDEVSGVIVKMSNHGAFASIEEGITGLVHMSNYENEDQLRNEIEIGKTYDFIIAVFDPVEQKLTLIPKDKYDPSKPINGKEKRSN